jgi:hypothetical protein
VDPSALEVVVAENPAPEGGAGGYPAPEGVAGSDPALVGSMSCNPAPEGVAVVELPELFQLKCLSPTSKARPHLNGNNPSIPRI